MKISKAVTLTLLIASWSNLQAQNVQLHYEARHLFDPELYGKNYPSLSFEYFKEFDSLGSFLLKIQSDFNGENYNNGQTFVQLSQNLKFWKTDVFLALSYTGGLGIAPPSFGFHITNAISLGVAHPFEWNGAFLSLNVQYRFTAFEKPSHDPQLTFYFWKGLFNYKVSIAGSLVSWTENRDQGIEFTSDLEDKKVVLFGDPQIWLTIKKGISVGSRVNMFYNLIGEESAFKVYPTIGGKYEF